MKRNRWTPRWAATIAAHLVLVATGVVVRNPLQASAATMGAPPVFSFLATSVDPLTSGTIGFAGIACPTASACVAAGGDQGASSGDAGVIADVDNGSAAPTFHISGTAGLAAVACGSATSCVAVGTGQPAGPGVPPTAAVVPIVNGAPGTTQLVAGVYGLSSVACPTTSQCYAVGSGPVGPGGQSQNGMIVPITNGVAGTTVVVGDSVGLRRISCPTAVTCYVLGTGIVGQITDDILLPVIAGVPGVAVPFSSSQAITALTCPTASTCLAVGNRQPPGPAPPQPDFVGVVVPISNGVPGPARPVAGSSAGSTIDCISESTCVASMPTLPPNWYTREPPLLQAAVVPIIDGIPGALQPIAGLQSLDGIACGGGATCRLIGGSTTPLQYVPFNAQEALATVSVGAAHGATFTYPLEGQTAVDTTQPYRWTTVTGAQGSYLVVGTSPFANNLYSSGPLPPTQTTVNGPALPVDQTLYATLLTEVGGTWSYQSITFTAQPGLATFSSPRGGAVGVDETAPLSWAAVNGAQAYYVAVGVSPGGSDLLNSGILPPSQTSIAILPWRALLKAGTKMYATLFTMVNGTFSRWQSVSYTVRAPYATMVRPSSGQSGVITPTRFSWTPVAGAQAFMLTVGITAYGSEFVAAQMPGTWTSYTIPALPRGKTLYATIMTMLYGNWYSNTVSFTTG